MFFFHFQVLQLFLGIHPCQHLDSWSRLIVTLSASQKDKPVTGCVCEGGGGCHNCPQKVLFCKANNIQGRGRSIRMMWMSYLFWWSVGFIIADSLTFISKTRGTLEIIALDINQDSYSNLHHRVMGSNTLICFVVFFVLVVFAECCLSWKPRCPCLWFWQQRYITPTFIVCSRHLV